MMRARRSLSRRLHTSIGPALVLAFLPACGGGGGTADPGPAVPDAAVTDPGSAALDAVATDPGVAGDPGTAADTGGGCTPACAAKACGDDGCGGRCGTCGDGLACRAGQCAPCTGALCDDMVAVEAGPFQMGCDPWDDAFCKPNAQPRHTVNVEAFEIDRLEVSTASYRACVDAGGCTEPSCGTKGDDYPVACVSWAQAKAYCVWAGKRLCSEAEWEKTARGTDGRPFPWGSETATCDYAVMSDESGHGCGTDGTLPVGSKPAGASPYGALDMAGNVWEWVEDGYTNSYDGAPTDGSAWVAGPDPFERCQRGARYASYDAESLRAYYRFSQEAALAWDENGIRCCRSL